MRRRSFVSAALGGIGLIGSLAGHVQAQEPPKPTELTPAAAPIAPAVAAEKPADAGGVRDTNAPAAAVASETKPAEIPAAAAPTAPDRVKPTEITAPVPAEPARVAEPVVSPPSAMGLDIAAAVQKLPARAGSDKRDMDAIVAFYASRNGEPLWHDNTGRKRTTVALVDEIGRAGDYGLDATALDAVSLKSAPPAGSTPDLIAADEVRISLAVLRYARHARGGRFEPTSLSKFLDRQTRPFEPATVLEQIASAGQPAAYLQQLHPQHPQFEKLRQKYLALRTSGTQAAALAKIPDGPRVLPGSTHPHVAMVRARLGVVQGKLASTPGNESVFDEALVTAVRDFQIARGLKPADGSIGNGIRQALNTITEGNPKKVLANMEQWRWMPDDLGSFYVWVNIPEYTLRVVSNGKVIHSERVIVGKTDTQTPIFSDEMEQVIFHPFWGVPDGIKSNEIQPSLARGQFSVLAKHNLRIQAGGRDIDPASVDWKNADLRRFHVYQPPGNDNVLGVVKFRFPNKHDVYMHDTPTKGLFSNAVRTYSHGCMRVQNPVRLAEVVLAEDKKMAADKVRSLAVVGAPANNQINLTRRIPVHITYFTAAVEDDGKARYFPDVYGHENRINLALEGKAHLIPKVNEPKGPVRAEPVASLFDASQKSSSRDWVRNAFTNN